jgi:clan AA aspartic protease
MGLASAKIKLSNPRRPDLLPVEIETLADTGALHLCIPEHIAIQLDLQEAEKREVALAGGSKKSVSYVGSIQMEFMNRKGFTGALVLGDEALIGAIPMEDMDLIVIPKTRTLAVNPESPNVPASVAKGMV